MLHLNLPSLAYIIFIASCSSMIPIIEIEDITWPRGDTKFLFECWIRGCLHEKTRTGASLIPRWLFFSYRVYIMIGSFHISLFEGTLHFDKLHVRFKIANITHALPVPIYHQTDFTPNRVVVSRLHEWYGCEISYRSVILAPVQQPGWTHAGVTRAGMTFCGGIM